MVHIPRRSPAQPSAQLDHSQHRWRRAPLGGGQPRDGPLCDDDHALRLSRRAFAGQPVTLTATLSDAGPANTYPTGTVSFYDGSSLLGTGTLVTSAGITTAIFNASLAIGSHSITAVYSGDAADMVSTSSPLLVAVSAVTAPTIGDAGFERPRSAPATTSTAPAARPGPSRAPRARARASRATTPPSPRETPTLPRAARSPSSNRPAPSPRPSRAGPLAPTPSPSTPPLAAPTVASRTSRCSLTATSWAPSSPPPPST